MEDKKLESIRGVAVLAVVSHHYYAHTGFNTGFFPELGGLLGVQLFFILSGYLIIQSAGRLSFFEYFLRRIFRIFPCFWLVSWSVAVFVSGRPLQYPFDNAWLGLLHFLSLSHLSPKSLMANDVLTVSWTLTVEWSWYILAPCLWVFSAIFDSSNKYWRNVALSLILISYIWVVLSQAGYLDGFLVLPNIKEGQAGFVRFAFLSNAFPAHWGFFGLGLIIWQLEVELRKINYLILIFIFMVFVPCATQWNNFLGVNPSIASGIGLLALFVMILKLPPFPFVSMLGKISYPVYLVHVPIIIVLNSHFGKSQVSMFMSSLLVILVVSLLIHRIIEVPLVVFGKRLVLFFRPGIVAKVPREILHK